MFPTTDANIESPKLPGVSVVICCYNSASRVSETLKHISKQQVGDIISWEIILVDNASSDDTQEVAKKCWSLLDVNVDLRIVCESKPGLSYARERGILDAKFDIIIFCDDDNLLCDTYVQTAYRIMTENTSIGIAGGWCEANVESSFANWMVPFLPALAVGKPAAKTSYLAKAGKCVNGAGMIVRNQHYQYIKEKGFYSLLDDRKQNTLSSGGDTELCWAMIYAGYEIYFDESLFFKHVIPSTRLKKEYFLKLTLTSLYPVIILSIYSFVFWHYRAGFANFFRNDMFRRITALLYYSPRMAFGKYPLYSSIVFRQNLKVLGLLVRKFAKVKDDFNRIKNLRQELIKAR
jgi:glycosyltransferase involved in cell wall biosynthesis